MDGNKAPWGSRYGDSNLTGKAPAWYVGPMWVQNPPVTLNLSMRAVVKLENTAVFKTADRGRSCGFESHQPHSNTIIMQSIHHVNNYLRWKIYLSQIEMR